MGLFSRKPSTPAPEAARVPAAEEIAAAGRALARGDRAPADRLASEAGEHGRRVAMQILATSVDHTPQD
ncbi:hypothetical protein [Streptomyces uncialis]|uniref:hypothetical protein n=1 Tax=Streptomyces uncialis TaxID=1048205 RepID=UPI00386461C3|nr:hypothetical protein OG924_17410 [Streptomyces uncialis]